MTKLSEAYIHLKPFEISDRKIMQVKQQLRELVEPEIIEMYSIEVELEIEIEKGSLISWIVVGGFLYTAIAGYGSFRSGLDYLISDARKAGAFINSNIRKLVKADKDQVYRSERRLGVPGQLQRVLYELDNLKKDIEIMNSEQLSQKIDSIAGYTEKVIRNIDDNKDRKYVINSIREDQAIKDLPNNIKEQLLLPLTGQSYIQPSSRKILQQGKWKVKEKTKQRIKLIRR
jgi:hypothetical protein